MSQKVLVTPSEHYDVVVTGVGSTQSHSLLCSEDKFVSLEHEHGAGALVRAPGGLVPGGLVLGQHVRLVPGGVGGGAGRGLAPPGPPPDLSLYPATGISVNLEDTRSPYDFPGMGSVTNAACGTVLQGAACSADPTHWSRPHPVSCDRLSCPTCWPRAVRKIARQVTDRFRGFLDAFGDLPITLDMEPERAEALTLLKRRAGRPLHVVYSMPPGTYSPDFPLDRLWREGIKAIKASDLLAGYVIFHPARLRAEVEYALRQLNRDLWASDEPTKPFWEHAHADALNLGDMHQYAYWSPHFHAVGIGYLVNARDYNRATGWIYKNKRSEGIPLSIRWNCQENRFEDELYTLFSYLMTHAAYVPHKRAVRTFGYLNPKHVKRVGDQFVKRYHDAVCPVCGSPVVRYWYKDDLPDQPVVDDHGEYRPVACRICGYNYKVRL